MLMLFKGVFGDGFINNSVIVFTHWQQSERAQLERSSEGVSEESKILEVNSEIKKMGFKL
jgi:hypothetical protein